MARAPLHTSEEIFKEADQLAASGKEVTPKTLRAVLGGGSLTTIYKVFDEWQEARKNMPASAPVEMPETVQAAFAQVWQTAANESAKDLATMREKADEQIKATTARFDEAMENMAQLEAEAATDAAKIEGLETRLTETDLALTEAARREAALTATVDQMGQQIEAQQVELARLHAEHSAARSEYAVERTRQETEFARQLAEQAAALSHANIDIERLRAKIDENAETAKLLAAREQAAIRDLTIAQTMLENQTAQLREQKGRSAEAITKLGDAKQQADAELHEARAAAIAAATQLGIVTGQCQALRTQVEANEALLKELVKGKKPGAGDDGTAKTTPAAKDKK